MSNASVNTVYAGESGPNNDENLKTGMLIATIIVAVALPILSLSAVATWITFSWLSIRRSVIMAFLGIYTIGLLIASIFVNLIDLFITSWTVNVPALFTSGGEGILGQVLVIVGKQAPLSIFFGVLIGVLYASFFWSFRKAEWEEVTFKLTPWEWARKRKTINDIEENKNIPHNGVTLGISELTGKRIIQTDEEGSAHTAYFGASGSGKTTTMMMTCRDIIQREHGLVFVDLKGDPKVAKKLQEFAEKEGRVFRHWSMQSIHAEYTGPSELGPAYYDPIARGEASRRKNLLMAIKKWSEPYYEGLAEEYLQKAFLVLIGNPNPDPKVSNLEDISSLLDPKVLTARAQKLIHDPKYNSVVEEIMRMSDEKATQGELSAIGSLRVDMKNLTHNVIGPWLKKDPNKLNDINLKDVAHKGEVVMFSLDSSSYPKESSVLGNLIIQDLKTVSAELREDPSDHPLHIIIDEFSAIGSDNIIQLINKCRDAKIPVSLSTQSLGDLRKVDPTFLDQLLGIINTFVIHRANLEEDAELYAGLTGRINRKKFRQSVEHTKNFFGIGKGSGAGAGFIEDVEEYKITVPEIQELETGHMIYVSKSPAKLEKVTVIQEKRGITTPNSSPAYVPIKRKVAESYNEYTPNLENGYKEYSEDKTTTLTMEKRVTEEEPVIEIRKSDPARLEKIFNRPATEFIDEKRLPEYNKHLMPPQKVSPEPTNAPEKPQNLAPPVFTLPPRKAPTLPTKPVTAKPQPREATPLQQQKITPPPVVKTKPLTKPQPAQQNEEPKIVFPAKDKFDF